MTPTRRELLCPLITIPKHAFIRRAHLRSSRSKPPVSPRRHPRAFCLEPHATHGRRRQTLVQVPKSKPPSPIHLSLESKPSTIDADEPDLKPRLPLVNVADHKSTQRCCAHAYEISPSPFPLRLASSVKSKIAQIANQKFPSLPVTQLRSRVLAAHAGDSGLRLTFRMLFAGPRSTAFRRLFAAVSPPAPASLSPRAAAGYRVCLGDASRSWAESSCRSLKWTASRKSGRADFVGCRQPGCTDRAPAGLRSINRDFYAARPASRTG